MSRANSGVWIASSELPIQSSNVQIPRVNSNSGISQTNHTNTNMNMNSGGDGQSVGGPIRRACPASGAQWNVQVVKGKMSGRCLWNACKALSLGLLLMVLGTAMATIGYYADRLSSAHVPRGNSTVKVKNETRGFHLNNLSYVGPIVMGVGGFIVVAACVMTFEARDSAAKVVPARFKGVSGGSAYSASHHRSGLGTVGGSSRRSAASQTPNVTTTGVGGNVQVQQPTVHEWDQQLGVFKTSPTDRRALTAALQQFSKELGSTCGVKVSPKQSSHHLSPILKTPLNRSPSAPLLCPGSTSPIGNMSEGLISPSATTSPRPSLHPLSRANYLNIGHTLVASTMKPGGCSLLSPAGLLKRHAVSFDESGPYSSELHKTSRESLQGSQSSMAMDLHYPNDCPVTLRVKDTARRRVLTRQKPVEAVEDDHPMHIPISTVLPHTTSHPKVHISRRRSSNASEHLHHGRKRRRDTTRPFLERAASTDARVMAHEIYMPSTSQGHRSAHSQETVAGVCTRHRANSIITGSGTIHERRTSVHLGHFVKGHHKTSSNDFRKQRSYSPKGSRETASFESKEADNGNRSN